MKRSTPKRRTPLRPGKPPKREKYLASSRVPLKPRKAGKPRRRAGACREYLDWLKTEACRITGKRTGAWAPSLGPGGVDWGVRVRVHVDPAHVRVKRLGGDLWNALSLARHLHEELHANGIKTFATKYNVDLKALAVEQTDQWLATPHGISWLAQHPESTA